MYELDEPQCLALQRVVHRVARAVAAAVPTERMYSLSLGTQASQCPPALARRAAATRSAYARQQFHTLMAENGVLDVDDEAQVNLARVIRSHLQSTRPAP